MHHNNYYFLAKLSEELVPVLANSVLYECYSQNKDELVLGFVLPDRSEFFIIANLGSEFSCLHFSRDINRAKRNTITLFEEVIGEMVVGLKQYENERAFEILFENKLSLVFKLFGNRANIILRDNESVIKIFKNSLKQDKTFVPQSKSINDSIKNLPEDSSDLKKVFYTFDDLFIIYLDSKGYNSKNESERKTLLDATISYLAHPIFYITEVSGKVVLSLFEVGKVLSKHTSAIEAINVFNTAHFRYNFLFNRKQKLEHKLEVKIASAKSFIDKSIQKKTELESQKSLSQIGDVIMANLHAIPSGAKKIKLLDFYSGEEIEVQLKSDLTAQKNAENYYKKAKKKPMEVENLENHLAFKQKQLQNLENDLTIIKSLESHKELEAFEVKYEKLDSKDKNEVEEKFKLFEVMGFQIMVGRNADNNDELTQKYATKNDLWLHAKDVTGSHVVIKFQAGKKFPKPVIEAAAGLAAYYSKRKNESLCPVIYTEKKYVRKVKGAPKGAVKVEKETVIMVRPKEIKN